MSHEPVGAAPCQCSSPGSKNDAVAGQDHLDWAASALRAADPFEDVDRLAVRMGVPGRSRARE